MPTVTSNFTNSRTQLTKAVKAKKAPEPKKDVRKVPKSKKVVKKETRAQLAVLAEKKALLEKKLADIDVIKKAQATEKKGISAQMALLEKQIREKKEKDDRLDANNARRDAQREEAQNMINEDFRRKKDAENEQRLAREEAWNIADDLRIEQEEDEMKKNVKALILSNSIVSRSSTTKKNVAGIVSRRHRMETDKEYESARLIQDGMRSLNKRRRLGYDSETDDGYSGSTFEGLTTTFEKTLADQRNSRARQSIYKRAPWLSDFS